MPHPRSANRAFILGSAKSFGTPFERLGRRAGMPFTIFPHMLRHACGYALVNAGHDTRALQACTRTLRAFSAADMKNILRKMS
jgi:integrase